MEEHFGEWWSPGGPRCFGRLQMEDDLFSLDLVSNLVPGAPVGYTLAVIHGESDGRPISLFRAQETARALAGGGPFPERLLAGEVVLGDHLHSWRAAAFCELEVHPPHLNEFIGRSGLALEDIPATRHGSRRRLIEWAEVDETALTVDRVRLRFRSDPGFEYASDFEFRLHHQAWLSLRSSRALSLATWDRRWLDSVCSLIAFGVERPVIVDRWIAYHQRVPPSGPRGRTIEVRVRRRRHEDSSRPASMFDQPFLTLVELGGSAARAIRGFERFRREHKEAAELLFEYQILNARQTPPDRFLNLARFLEAFHRTRFSSSRSRPVMRTRLADVVSGPGAVAGPYLGGSPDALVDLVLDTRNYYVHYDPGLEARAVHDLELDDLCDRLWMVVRACIMDEIGVPASISADALRRDAFAERLRGAAIAPPGRRRRP